jgi:hypothetical protein
MMSCDITVEKNLITVHQYETDVVVLFYDILLTNKTDDTIKNIDIEDSLFGLFTGTHLIGVTVSITSCSENLVAYNEETAFVALGKLVDNTKSYLPPCSVSKIKLGVGIFAATSTTTNVNYLKNTLIVRGCYENCDCYLDKVNIKPIIVKSDLWESINGKVLKQVQQLPPIIPPGVPRFPYPP